MKREVSPCLPEVLTKLDIHRLDHQHEIDILGCPEIQPSFFHRQGGGHTANQHIPVSVVFEVMTENIQPFDHDKPFSNSLSACCTRSSRSLRKLNISDNGSTDPATGQMSGS